ncbi:hypothetical protein Barb7_02938 [Bacteroidales bacterium Barb7]|nr:hypothetical protein Barb7_02938 [Bacteroidales bacterium Barb7]
MRQLCHPFEYGKGHAPVGGKALKPAPAAFRRLFVKQAADGDVPQVVRAVAVEEKGQAVLLLRLADGIKHPRGFLQECTFQLFVLLQIGKKGGRGSVCRPTINRLLQVGVGCGNMGSQRIGIVGSEP